MNEFNKAFSLALILVVFSIFSASSSEKIPDSLKEYLNILRAPLDSDIEEIKRAYFDRINDLRSSNINNKVVKIDFETRRKVKNAFKKIMIFHNQNPKVLAPSKFYFEKFSDFWVKEGTPSDIEEYLNINLKKIEPKLSEAFTTIKKDFEDFPPSFDVLNDGPKGNAKLNARKSHYIGYNKIKEQADILKGKLIKIEQVDLYRNLLLLQIYSKTSFDQNLVEAAVLTSNDEKIDFLYKSTEMLLENKERHLNDLNLRGFETELRDLLSFSHSKRFKEINMIMNNVYSNMVFFHNHLLSEQTSPFLYSYFKGKVNAMISLKNPLQAMAWEGLEEHSQFLRKRIGPGVDQLYIGVFADHLNKINSSEEYSFFQKLAWQGLSIFREFESNDLLEIKDEDFLLLDKANRLTEEKIRYINKLDTLSSDELDFVLTTSSVQKLLDFKTILLSGDCRDDFRSLLD